MRALKDSQIESTRQYIYIIGIKLSVLVFIHIESIWNSLLYLQGIIVLFEQQALVERMMIRLFVLWSFRG